jgi:hypothetical protein
MTPWILASAAVALGDSEEIVLDYGAVGLIPAGSEQPAMGPDRIAGGPEGRFALHNPATRSVLVFDALQLSHSIPVQGVDDLLFAPNGDLLILELDRRVRRFSPEGALLQVFPLPALVPTHVRLAVQADRLVGVDPFGNGHSVATMTPGGLEPTAGPALTPPAHAVRWNGHTLQVDGQHVPIDAAKASGRVLDGGASEWLVVEAVVGDSPIRVERWALLGDARVDLPVDGRLYAPTQDLAVDANGRLLVLEPRTDGLHIVRVSP